MAMTVIITKEGVVVLLGRNRLNELRKHCLHNSIIEGSLGVLVLAVH